MANEDKKDFNAVTELHLLYLGIMIVITVAYTLILTRTLPKKQWGLTNHDFKFSGEAHDESE